MVHCENEKCEVTLLQAGLYISHHILIFSSLYIYIYLFFKFYPPLKKRTCIHNRADNNE